PKCSLSATAMKYRNWRRSGRFIPIGYYRPTPLALAGATPAGGQSSLEEDLTHGQLQPPLQAHHAGRGALAQPGDAARRRLQRRRFRQTDRRRGERAFDDE